MTNTPTLSPAGWYPAPDGSATTWWWDGATWSQQRPTPPPVSSPAIAKLALTTQVLLIVCGVLAVATIGLEAFGINAVANFLNGSDTTTDALDIYDRSTSVVSIATTIAIIATGILWAIWQYRAARHLAGLTRRSAGWHAGSWFVPIVSFWFPYQNISDLWRAMGRTRPSWQIAWWVLFIGSNILVGQSTRLYLAAQDLEQFRVAMWVNLVGEILAVAAVPLACLIVRGITQGLMLRPTDPVPSPGA
ncbi:DUF4328 domain-containing protein [Agromyces allii]|uniref:DUF4328 domain-containing protein n=1 Tax=Agromyces allii TaxID=393607 RepID=A0ABN2QZ64_9MICO|nr:DUF4328 domain-containing protein [Agromyces allii]